MNGTVTKLLAECRARGISLRLGEGGKLRVSPPPERLPGEVVEELKRHKQEILALLTQQQEPSPWSCPHCGASSEIEAVEPSLDGSRMLTYWRCEPCQIWAVTPSTLRAPPVWVSSRKQ